MVQVYFGNRNPWDSHSDIFDHRKLSQLSDRPMASLIGDLKTSGLLEETIVMIGGEFGRTPSRDGDARLEYCGRGHYHLSFTTVMAGGGFKKGLAYGATDDLGWKAVENPVTSTTPFFGVVNLRVPMTGTDLQGSQQFQRAVALLGALQRVPQRRYLVNVRSSALPNRMKWPFPFVSGDARPG